MKTQLITPEARKTVLIGRQTHRRFKVVRDGGMPTDSFYEDEWVYIPHSTMPDMPQVGRDIIDVLRRARVPIKGFVIAHEAPRLLTAPKTAPKPDLKTPTKIVSATEVLEAFVMGLLLIFSLAFVVVRIDPALIVVLEDGTWVEVMTWYED